MCLPSRKILILQSHKKCIFLLRVINLEKNVIGTPKSPTQIWYVVDI